MAILGAASGRLTFLWLPVLYIVIEIVSYLTTYYTVDEADITIQKGLIKKRQL
ncbi:hypothetical protein [Holzapfeliella floricola]|uniref:hypothetical protein n=1 Tax=Holzapfeliella floricola TaxID=679249 RepID=UPI001A90DF27|nr:hypothetical protein [Holzapfeliella floricola]